MIFIQSKTILIVEDEPALLHSLVFTLKRFHYSVKGFTDGMLLLKELLGSDDKVPDLIITEIQLLSTEGLEMIDEIRISGIVTPIMAVISFNDKRIIEELKKRNVTSFLVKPFSMDDFIEKVDRCLTSE